MLARVPEAQRADVLNTLLDSNGHSLLHLAVARRSLPLARLLLGMVSATGRSNGAGRCEWASLLRTLAAYWRVEAPTCLSCSSTSAGRAAHVTERVALPAAAPAAPAWGAGSARGGRRRRCRRGRGAPGSGSGTSAAG